MLSTKINVVTSDNVCLEVIYNNCFQNIIQQEATHFMFTHNSLVFVVPHDFQTMQSCKMQNITYHINLTNLSHLVAQKMILTADAKAILTDPINISMFHMLIKHPATQVQHVHLVDDY